MATDNRLLHLVAVIALLASFFVGQPAPAFAAGGPPDYSADVDSDGLPDSVERAGWSNESGGPYFTDPTKIDSDGDGLTDGEEKLFGTNPLDDHSPGIYVDYQNSYQTRKYYPWMQFGSRFIATNASGSGAVVIRRGTTFSVGGPKNASLTISGSGLTTLSATRDPCNNRWDISVPSGGTVGVYTLRMQDGTWSQSLKLDVIFQLPTNQTAEFIDAYVYDDSMTSTRDTTALAYWELDHHEYTHSDYSWIPSGQWVTHGYAWGYDTQHYDSFLFQDQVMPTISGSTSTWSASNRLIKHVDDVTCFGNPRAVSTSWCALHPSTCGPDYNNKLECTSIADLATAFNRSAGIPSRPSWTDWIHSSFDHATEVWTQPSGGSQKWYLEHGYSVDEYDDPASNHCASQYYSGGYSDLRSTNGWYTDGQGVYTIGPNWVASEISGGSPYWDGFRLGSWDHTKIVKKPWWVTRFMAYLGWSSEPTVVGTPPADWPPPPAANMTPVDPVTRVQYDPNAAVQVGQVMAATPVDSAGTGIYDQLVFQVQVQVNKAGRYYFRGVLNGNRADSVGTATLDVGKHTIELPFDGMDLFMRRMDGPYSLDGVWVTDVENPSPAAFSQNPVGFGQPDYQTAAWKYTDFGRAGARLNGQYSYHADGDALVLETGLNIGKAGTYKVEGVLETSQGGDPFQASWTGTDSKVSLRFAGLRGTQGPYKLIGLSVRDAAGQLTDGLTDPYVIQSVSGLDIKPVMLSRPNTPEIAPQVSITNTGYSDAGLDLNGDGLFDQLVITATVTISPSEAGLPYRLEGWLTDSNGNLISYAMGTPQNLAAGLQSLPLAFDGRIINEHGVDGPYTLTALKVLPGGAYQVLDKVEIAYTTRAYNHNQFKPAVIRPGGTAFADNMENGSANWTAQSSAWRLATDNALSGSYGWATTPGSGSQSSNLTSVPLNLSQYADLTLRFNTCYRIPTGSNAGYLEVSGNGVDWTRVATYTGTTTSWTNQLADLSAWGHPSSLQVRFKEQAQNGLRWYLDDVFVYGWPAVSSASFTYSPASVTLGTNVTFSAVYTTIDSTAPVTYTWNFGDGTPPLVTQSPTVVHRWATPEGHDVQLTVANPWDDAVATRFVGIHPPVSAVSVGYTALKVTEGVPVTFSASTAPVTATRPITLTWNWGDGTPPVVTTTTSVAHAFSQTGNYVVQVTANNGYGSPVTGSTSIFIGRALSGVTVTYTPTTPMQRDWINFSPAITPANATQPIQYTWDFGDGSPTLTTPFTRVVHAYRLAGNFTVWVTATGTYNTVSGSGLVNIAVNPAPERRLIYLPIMLR